MSLNALCGGGPESFEEGLTPVSLDVIESSSKLRPFPILSHDFGPKLINCALVVAIVLFGDPSHVENATYNAGTSDNEGVCPPYTHYPKLHD